MSKKMIWMLMITMILFSEKDVFADTARAGQYGTGAVKDSERIAVKDSKRDGERHVKHMAVAQEAGLRDAAVHFSARDVPSSNSRKGRDTGDAAVAEPDVKSMLFVGLVIALVSIFRRMRRA